MNFGLEPRSGRTGAAFAALLSGTLLVTSGCSFGDDGPKQPAAPSGPAPDSRQPVPAVAAASPGATAPAGLPVLASRDATATDIGTRVEVNDLRVSGRTTRLTFTARNTSPAVDGAAAKWHLTDYFANGTSDMKDSAAQYAEDYGSVDGVYLLDPAGAKRYLAARVADGGCVCSTGLGSTFLGPGEAIVLSGVYAALPAGVTKVDVYVPHVGVLPDIPVSR